MRGQEVPLATGIAEAARLLLDARYPLIYGFGETTCEAQQHAVAIADWVGGTIDTATSFGHAPSIMAFPWRNGGALGGCIVGLLRICRLSFGVFCHAAGLRAQASEAQHVRPARMICALQPFRFRQRAVRINLVEEFLSKPLTSACCNFS